MAKTLQKLILLRRYLKDANISGWSKFLFFLPLIYFISPIDLFPDVIFPFGFIEDVGVLFFGWQLIQKELAKYSRKVNPQKKAEQDKGKVVEMKRDDYTVD